MSLRKRDGLLMPRTALGLAAWVAAGLLAAPVCAQYVGKVTKDAKEAPPLRSIAVLEWTGDAGSPTASRLIPVAVLDAGQLQDGSVYLARPEPLALTPEVEYELQQDGKPVGLFDIKNAGQADGGWVGFGAWKPLPSAKPKPLPKKLEGADFEDAASDTPVLHRKHHADDTTAPGKGKTNDKDDSSTSSDPDRPVLHKKTSPDATGSAQTDSDPDRPTLHKKSPAGDSSDSQTASTANNDPDRPVLKKPKKSAPVETAGSDSSNTDPDRPRLRRGKASSDDLEVAPSLKGFPPDVQQAVAVSDSRSRPSHPWTYEWSNPDDETKMKSTLEDMARTALGLTPPPSKPAPRRNATAAKRVSKPAPPAAPAPLESEQFRVFELAYGSSATLVLSAHTGGPPRQQKFVTIVAQPDLYGNVLVLLKNVTDGTHLDQTPRMRLVDAVDAMADNRGELLFELRGATQRQFALYRVLRGQAEKIFVSGGDDGGAASN